MTRDSTRYSAPAAGCAVAVLGALGASDNPLSLAGLQRQMDHSKSLIYRTLSELEQADFVVRDANASYRLGLRAFEVGVAYVTNNPLNAAISSALRDLASDSGEATNLGVLRGDEVLYVMKIDGGSSYVTISRVGGRVPATCVANGKALLAVLAPQQVRQWVSEPLPTMTAHSHRSMTSLEEDLAQIRARGYARDDDEAVVGRAGLAVTIPYPPDPSGRAAISLSTGTGELDDEGAGRMLRLLTDAGDRIKREVSARQSLPT